MLRGRCPGKSSCRAGGTWGRGSDKPRERPSSPPGAAADVPIHPGLLVTLSTKRCERGARVPRKFIKLAVEGDGAGGPRLGGVSKFPLCGGTHDIKCPRFHPPQVIENLLPSAWISAFLGMTSVRAATRGVEALWLHAQHRSPRVLTLSWLLHGLWHKKLYPRHPVVHYFSLARFFFQSSMACIFSFSLFSRPWSVGR